MHATPLNIGLVQILQGENPSFVGNLLGGEVKLGNLMFGLNAKAKKEKRYVPLGCPWTCMLASFSPSSQSLVS